MKPRDYFISQIQHIETRPVPYSLGYEYEVAERVDKYYGNSDWRKNLVHYGVFHMGIDTIQEVRISDSRVKDIYGGIWRTDKRPFHLEQPAMKERSFQKYNFPPVSQFADLVYKSKEEAIKKIKVDGDSFSLIHMVWGLFELSWRIRGFENALIDAIEEPEFYTELIERITELYIEIIRICSDVPADAFFFSDDWGEQRGVIMGPERWRKLIKPYWSRIYKEVHKQGKYVISHCCGSIVDIMPDVVETGMDVLESVQPEARGMCPYELKEKWGDNITFWGGLGSQSIIPFGTPGEINTEIGRLLSKMGKGGGYIISPAKALLPETPTENAVAVIEAFMNQ